ncbi:Calx-beta domain-containing protein [Bdellovibrio bacteriovorus]|uniref:Cell wall anchor protein n=1 Tax=Bdellovibrio bacteriovorus TaxID=959 RepID=A0A1Z3N9Q3_BDEBC|nr:Calx-beta domain-containing protein [Bdellovibrio bacteriovorus]ASD64151.1 cell wall anchor protein [Bdellovibrio bacteriovorus]
MFDARTFLTHISTSFFALFLTSCMDASLSPLLSENQVLRKITVESGKTVVLEEGIGHQITLGVETPSVPGVTVKPEDLGWTLNDEDGDFEASNGTLLVQPGITSVSFIIKATRDAVIENDETFELRFTGEKFEGLDSNVISFVVKDKTTRAKVTAAATLDFGPQMKDTVIEKSVSFQNTGDAPAQGLTLSTLSAPFAFKGGSFPGNGGTCSTTLNGHSSCSVVITYSPTEVNTHSQTLTWNYTNPDIADNGSLGISGLGVEVAAVLGGRPANPSNVEDLDITVSGTNVTHYRYKVGPQGSTDCTVSSGYSTETAVGAKITDDLAALANQSLKICVVGKDSNNFWQPFTAATVYTWNYDTLRPSVVISQKTGQADPTNTLPVRFSLVFSEALAESSLTDGDVSFAGSALVNTHTLTKIDSTHYELTVSGVDNNGVIQPVINADKFSDLAGNLNTVSTSSDNQVTYDTSAPSLPTSLSWIQTSPTKVTPAAASWTLSDSSDIAEQKIQFYKDASCLLLEGTAISLSTSAVTRSFAGADGETYTYNLTVIDTSGNVSVSGCSTALTMDRTAPSLASFNPATSVRASLPASVTVTFSEAMLQSAVETESNWGITCSGGANVSIAGVSASSATAAVVNLTVTTLPANAEVCTLTAKTTLTDVAGNALPAAGTVQYTLDLPGTVVSVTSSLANGSYKASQVVPVSVQFTENVTIAGGTPELLIETGSTDRVAAYVSGSGTNTLVFQYTVQAGDNSADLDYESVNALTLAGATIKDSFGNDMILTLPAPGAAGSLSANKNIIIDTQAPEAFVIAGVTGGTDSTQDEWLTNGSTGTIHWAAAPGSTQYLVEIRNSDASAPVCAQQTVTTTSHTSTGCALSNGTQYTARISAQDAVGNSTAATNNDFVFTVNTSAVIATITGQPTGKTNQTTLNIDVAGADVQTYRYKIGPAASTNCAVATDYSGDIAIATHITDSISGLGNTDIKVCVIGKNSASVEQALTSATTATWTQDLAAPTLTINQKAGQADPTNAVPVEFTIVASEAIANFAVADITQSGTASGITWSLTTSDNITWSLKATAITGAGTLIPSITANKVTDAAGNNNTASTSTDNQITYETTKPSLTINQKAGQTDPTNTLPVEFTVVFTEAVNASTFTAADITQGGTASGITWNLSTSDNITWTLQATAITTAGTLIPSITAGKVSDPAGNTNNASTTTDSTVTYDITAPVNATSLAWQQTSPTNTTSLVASWSKSTSTDLASQKVRFYTGASCDTYTGTENAATSSATTSNFTGVNGTTYTYQVISLDAAGNSITSVCSSAIVIDTTVPTVTNVTSNKANGAYTVGDVIDVRITFSENVTVTGTPLIALNTTPARSASYASGTGTNTLVFNYTVQATDTAADLNYAATTSLTVASATIRDAAANNATLTLPATGAAGSLGTNKNIVIDTTAPSITTFTVTNTTPTNSTTFNITSAVSGSPATYCIMENNTAVASCTWTAGASLPATFTVTTVNEAKTLYAWVKDAAGNVSAMASSASITFDNTPPTATLSGQPTGSSAKYALNIDVNGSDVVAYKYKLGVAGSTDCTVATGYSASEISSSTNITDNISALANGSIKVCVVGKDTAGNWQTYATATAVTWTKNSPAIQFSATTSSVSEYNDPTHTVAVSIPSAVDIAVSVSYTYSNGSAPSATMGSDYTATNGTATIAAGSTSVNISIPILDNSTEEYDETFKITLSGPVGGSLGANTVHTVTITDDEAPPLVTIQDVYVVEGSSTSLMATLSHPTDKGSVSINWTRDTCTGTDCATVGTDYTMATTSGTASVASGATSVTFGSLTTINNAADELYKRIPIKITGITGGTSYISNADIFINDNDSPAGKDAVDVVAGDNHTCALTSNGNVYCWGHNGAAPLGQGHYYPSSSPLLVPLAAPAVGIASLYNNVCAVLNTGALYCWGQGSHGTYPGGGFTGTSSISTRLTPTLVTGMNSGVTQVSIGWGNSCAIQNGAVYCWGIKEGGILGDPATASPTTAPVAIASLNSGVTKISSGQFHACAIKSGALYCWGQNSNGEVGVGSTTLVGTPTAINGLGTVTDVWTGYYGTCAKNNSNQVYCWGNNSDNQLLSNTTADVTSPLLMAELAGATDIYFGIQFCAALAGDLHCKGRNYFGEAGINQPTGTSVIPLTPVVGGSGGVTAVAGSTGAHTCFVRSGQVYCTGFSGFGQHGDQQPLQSNAHVLSPKFSGASTISIFTEHACGIFSGAVKCLGDSYYSKTGNLLTDRIYQAPTQVKNLTSGATKLVSSSTGTCAVVSGGVQCWGRNFIRASGSTSGNPNIPTGLSSGATDLAMSFGSTVCAIKAGKLYCWGQVDIIPYLDLAVDFYYAPVEITAAGSNNVSVTLGRHHACVLKTDKTVWCTGYNAHGQLGQGDTSDRISLHQVPGLTNVDELQASSYGTCARIGTTSIKCWGQITGNGTNTNQKTPVDIGSFTNVTRLISGYTNHCAINNGAAYCWGFNRYDQHGLNDYQTNEYHFSPTALTTLNAIGTVTDLEVRGAYGICGKIGTNWYCSGIDTNSELGTNRKPFRLAPVSMGPFPN